ncbi:MAG: dihydropteroate synthase, partial [Alphaproteobacteria bacterium]|nr:dihydropteroate synthase [Alphaproteobacteria bacterium]
MFVVVDANTPRHDEVANKNPIQLTAGEGRAGFSHDVRSLPIGGILAPDTRPEQGLVKRQDNYHRLCDIATSNRQPERNLKMRPDPRPALRLSRHFDWSERTYVMGILNVTPDSFSGDGLQTANEDATVARAVAQAQRFIESGADILDIGAESTRPGAEILGAEAELSRILPVIESVRAMFPDIPISVDTYRAAVAEQAFDAGADMVNDVWGFRADPELAGLAASRGAPVILMHNRSKPGDAEIDARLGGVYRGAQYDDLLADIT